MDRIFYRACSFRDPITNYPIYIFDTSYLPSPDTIDYDDFIPVLMSHVPTRPYVCIMFSCGLNKISWVWGIKFLKAFLDNAHNLNNLIKIFPVHDSWFVKSITQIVHNYNSTKKNLDQITRLLDTFSLVNSKDERNTHVIYCKNLSELSHYLDITRLKISLSVYKHDLLLEPSIQLSMRVIPIINPLIRIDKETHEVFHHHLYQIFNIIHQNGDKVELIFHKPGNKAATEILYQCILRNQLISINDWDLYCISTAFKKILMELPFPLIPLESIQLPIRDDYEYTLCVLQMIIVHLQSNHETKNYDQLLLQLIDTFHHFILNNEITKHTSTTISRCLSHCLSHEPISNTNKDHILIVSRFTKNTLEHWESLKPRFTFCSINESIEGAPIDLRSHQEKEYDTSYSMNYDISLQKNEVDRVNSNTASILPSSRDTSPANTLVDNSSSSTSSTSSVRTLVRSSETLADTKLQTAQTNNVQLQFPPQKYKFLPPVKQVQVQRKETEPKAKKLPPIPIKKPVIRGRKVSELAKLFEERSQAIEILNGM
ncbi:ECM25 [[Candida] subhashii]|uniref:ECM25 n=1 Tax=[Candida] subhashii TaxID=561895 RepID=A0A8J5Q5A1_9ASCO|nr:ECM25 [[Candida] subhashii]KAG7660666.1 ECM25 [[Candida] subhashii]